MLSNIFSRAFIFSAAVLVVGTFTLPEAVGQDVDSDFEPREINTQYEQVRLVKIAGGLEFPWSIAFLPDDRKLVTERPGRLNLVEDGQITEISGVPEVQARGQGGLLEVAIHPDFEMNQWVYLTWSKANDDGETVTALGRGTLQGNSLTSFEVLFVQDRYSSPGRHYGSRLAWADDGKLLMSIGDRGANPPRAQDLGDHAGTLLRLNDDGSIPDDNPFVGRDDVLPEIYSYGHRNIQGLVVDPETGDIWATEHGPRGGDELNLVQPGLNYGWPTVSLGLDYRSQGDFPHTEARTRDGMIDPVLEFMPTLAPSGLAMVTSDRFPNWKGDLLAGGLRSERILRTVIHNYEVLHQEELLLGEIGRIRDVREGSDGYIYILNDTRDGGVFRIEPRN